MVLLVVPRFELPFSWVSRLASHVKKAFARRGGEWLYARSMECVVEEEGEECLWSKELY